MCGVDVLGCSTDGLKTVYPDQVVGRDAVNTVSQSSCDDLRRLSARFDNVLVSSFNHTSSKDMLNNTGTL